MSEEEKHLFHQSNSCWICKKLIDNDEEKVRDHCHVTGQFRVRLMGVVTNLQLTKKIPVIFNELDKFDVNISVMQNGLEKYMAFFLNKNLAFIDIMQFMNSSLIKLVKKMKILSN